MEPLQPAEKPIPDLPFEPYRGIKPFRYADRKIFSARDWEKEQLLNLILLYRGSLLYGQSGIGKSSLINAGLVPLLENNNLNAEIIRVYPNRNETFCIYKIGKSDDGKSYFPSLFDNFSKQGKSVPTINISFEDFKQHLLQQTHENAKNNIKPTPVLIFDQFEELVTLFEETGKNTVAKNDVSVDKRADFQSELISFFRECYYNPELRLKFLFSFREDYLAKLSQLIRAIPDLRDHSLRIKAIDKDDIEEIIRCPFLIKEPNGISAYNNSLSEAEIVLLNEKILDFFKDQDAVLTDVQIACQYVYETEPEKRDELFHYKGTDIEESIEKIIQLFYAKQLEKLSDDDRALATDILSLLVLNEHTRNIFHIEAIIEELKNQYPREAIVRVLLALDNDTRLIKSEIRPGGTYYEINSESLIPYINSLKILRNQAKEKKLAKELEREKNITDQLTKEKEKAIKQKEKFKKILMLTISALLTIAVIIAVIEFINSVKNRNQLYLMEAKNTENPTLSYSIAKTDYEKSGHDSLFEHYIKSQKKLYSYITDIFSYPGNIISIFFNGNNIGVIGENSIDYFDKNGLMKKQLILNDIIYADPKSGYLITKTGTNDEEGIDTCQLRKLDGTIVSTFVSPQSPNVFAISPDGQTFLVNKFIYKTGNMRPSSRMLIPLIGKDLMTAIFTKDNKHVIAGFWSGHVIVYDLDGKMVKAFMAGSFNSVVTCLGVCKNSQYLVVGGRNNNLCYFELGDINLPGKDSISADDYISNPKTIYLENSYAPGQINNVVVAPDDSTFLTVADDKIGDLWNLNGKKINVLIGHKESIASAAFSADGKQIITWSSRGIIYLWQKNIENDANNDKLVTFSPFDYRNTEGFEDYRLIDAYPNLTQPDSILKSALNYLASFPEYNDHPENQDYNKVINTSLGELSGLFLRLLRPLNTKKLSVLNKKLLYNSYGTFRTDSLNLTEGRSTTTASYYTRCADKMYWQSKALQTDTADIKSAIKYAYLFDKLAQFFADTSINNYKMAVSSEKNGIALAGTFKLKYPENPLLNAWLANLYGNLSWYALFIKDYNTVISSAKTGIGFGKNYDWIYTNLATGYLLSGKFNEAEQIYNTYKDRNKSDGLGSFKAAFLQDLQTLTNAGIINMKDKKMSAEVARIHTIIGNDL